MQFRKFLDTIDAHTPPELDLHLILDDSSSLETPPIHRWLPRHPRALLHFTPTSASWLDLVKCWFALPTTRPLARGTVRSTRALEQAIESYIAATDGTETADEILESVARYCQQTTSSRH